MERKMVIIGYLYCLLWYASILGGYALLFCPLLPVVFISNKLYRYITDVLFTFWQFYPTALLEIVCGCNIQVTGDPIRTGETSILVMNHRTRTDWNFFWPTAYHGVEAKGKLFHSTKMMLKDVIRHIPGAGWVMQLACFVYIKRCWLIDKKIIENYAKYVSDLSYKHSLLVFPEGTDFTDTTKKSSDNYALKNGLQKYDYVLHPRTTGFVYLASQMMARKSLDSVYDVTLIYPDVVPQSEKTLLKGHFPKEVKVHFARYPVSVLPKSEDGLRNFLEKKWLEKEKIIKEFRNTGNFLHGDVLKCNKPWELYVALIFWTLLPYVTLYFFFTSYWFRYIVLIHTFIMIILNIISDGFQNFEIALYFWKQRFRNNVKI